MTTAEEAGILVERELARLLGTGVVTRGRNGEIEFPSGSSVTTIRVEDGPSGPIVRLRAAVLDQVRCSEELLLRLNDLNARTPFVRFYWSDGAVSCAAEIAAQELQEAEIFNALSAVAAYADHADNLLQHDFGGTTGTVR